MVNYLGPYVSDGKYQTSVAFGNARPTSELDSLARLHDTAYAVYGGRAERESADRLFKREADKIGSTISAIAGTGVVYGNYAARQVKDLGSKVASGARFGPLGALAGAVSWQVNNLLQLNKRLTTGGELETRTDSKVQRLYDSDPSGGSAQTGDAQGKSAGSLQAKLALDRAKLASRNTDSLDTGPIMENPVPATVSNDNSDPFYSPYRPITGGKVRRKRRRGTGYLGIRN